MQGIERGEDSRQGTRAAGAASPILYPASGGAGGGGSGGERGKPRVCIVVGMAGSGKSTLLQVGGFLWVPIDRFLLTRFSASMRTCTPAVGLGM
jgi:hypothetical protein